MLLKKYLYPGFIIILAVCSFYFSAKKKINIVFIGDSITQGADSADAPPVIAAAYLNGKLGKGQVKISNQGVSGCTTTDFLPATGTHFKDVSMAADKFYKDKNAVLLFSIMLGTNDSAIEGPLGSPASPEKYRENMKTIIDKLLNSYPGSKIIIHYPTWYSPNTYNRSRYLQEGLDRLQSYSAVIKQLVAGYSVSNKGQVFEGDKSAFNYFKKNHLALMEHENGQQGEFYLHPNKKGAADLGRFWAKAILKIN